MIGTNRDTHRDRMVWHITHNGSPLAVESREPQLHSVRVELQKREFFL